VRDYRSRNDKGIYPIAKFKFYNDRNVFICPEEKELKYWGYTNTANNMYTVHVQKTVRFVQARQHARETERGH